MKRTIAVLLSVLTALCAALSLAACSKGKTPGPAAPTETVLNTPLPTNDSSTHKETENNGNVKVTPVPVQTEGQGSHDIGPAGTSTYVIKSEDTYDDYGFAFFIAERDAEYNVVMESGGSKAEWSVYVLDEKFTDVLRYLPQAYEPALSQSGALQVKAGQYVYVHCSANSFSAQSPVSGATITFEGQGLPKQ